MVICIFCEGEDICSFRVRANEIGSAGPIILLLVLFNWHLMDQVCGSTIFAHSIGLFYWDELIPGFLVRLAEWTRLLIGFWISGTVTAIPSLGLILTIVREWSWLEFNKLDVERGWVLNYIRWFRITDKLWTCVCFFNKQCQHSNACLFYDLFLFLFFFFVVDIFIPCKRMHPVQELSPIHCSERA